MTVNKNMAQVLIAACVVHLQFALLTQKFYMKNIG